ncbi:hypothetical protein P5673_004114 [Acropora cervicornis]|uniref:Uncharacterized protein n=1 Tax=Acropora cervicornis TaxID=6130 RepID=A0AAD9R2C3_ACRCE|nr:hypothetical protein P5673_004114 [Acropora cervicornis]
MNSSAFVFYLKCQLWLIWKCMVCQFACF